jgi:hypothetical protein
MAFIVQEDTPVTDANSYVSVAYFRDYHADRGTDNSSHRDEDVQIALIKATQYVDLRFKYVGERVSRTQELEWPRQFAYNDRGDTVIGLPSPVKQATCEYAIIALARDLLPSPVDADGVNRVVKSRSETLGPLERKFEYDTKQGYNLPEYPKADRLLIGRGLVSETLEDPSTAGGLTFGRLGRS